jgi:hypothetical protein
MQVWRAPASEREKIKTFYTLVLIAIGVELEIVGFDRLNIIIMHIYLLWDLPIIRRSISNENSTHGSINF